MTRNNGGGGGGSSSNVSLVNVDIAPSPRLVYTSRMQTDGGDYI